MFRQFARIKVLQQLTKHRRHRMQTYQINCASYYFTSFAFLPLLAAAKTVGNHEEPGNIINISSISAITYTSQGGQFNYHSSKAAALSLSKQLACEFARRDLGIRVNGTFRSRLFETPSSYRRLSFFDSQPSAQACIRRE
jgi:NAD(P)-dependent dehydrogenase (short-subunit alcohol dehydrogenase family)